MYPPAGRPLKYQLRFSDPDVVPAAEDAPADLLAVDESAVHAALVVQHKTLWLAPDLGVVSRGASVL